MQVPLHSLDERLGISGIPLTDDRNRPDTADAHGLSST